MKIGIAELDKLFDEAGEKAITLCSKTKYGNDIRIKRRFDVMSREYEFGISVAQGAWNWYMSIYDVRDRIDDLIEGRWLE